MAHQSDVRRSFLPPLPPPPTPLLRHGNTGRVSEARNYTRIGSMAATSARKNTLGNACSMSVRQSLVPGGGRHLIKFPKILTIPKDERNLRETAVKIQIQKRVFDFLTEYGANSLFGFTMETLKSPQMADFKNIFTFIVQQLYPASIQMKIIKAEDEIPLFLQTWGYPYPPIKPSAIRSFNAPHTWPTFLGVLDWLIDLVECSQSNPRPMLSNEMAHDFHIKCYRKLTAAKLNRDDTFQPDFFDAEFQAYRQIVLGAEVEQELDKFRRERRQNEEKSRALKDKYSKLAEEVNSFGQSIQEHGADIVELNRYTEDLHAKEARVEENIFEAKKKLDLRSTIEEIMNENLKKEQLIATQKVSREEVHDIQVKRKTIIAQRKDVEIKLNDVETRRNQLQPEAFRKSSKVRSAFEELRGGLRELVSSLYSEDDERAIFTIAKLNDFNFDYAFHGSSSNWLSDLMADLAAEADNQLNRLRSVDNDIALQREEFIRQVRSLENLKQEKLLNFQMKETELKRHVADSEKVLRETEISIEPIRKQHEQLKNVASAQTAEANEAQEDVAEFHKTFVEHKQSLGKDLIELKKLHKIQIQKHVDRYKQLLYHFYKYVKLLHEAITLEVENMPSDQVVALAAAKHRLSQLETFMKETEGSAQPADNDD